MLEHESFMLWLVPESQEQGFGPKWENGQETLHFCPVTYGFLISLCKGKTGGGKGSAIAAVHTLSPHHSAATTPGPQRHPHFLAMLAEVWTNPPGSAETSLESFKISFARKLVGKTRVKTGNSV